MRKFTGFITLVLTGLLLFVQKPMAASNDIYTVASFEEIEKQVHDEEYRETLLVLDVDYTLTHPSNPAFQKGNFALSPEFIKKSVRSLPKPMRDEFATRIATSGEGHLLEVKTPAIISSLKQKGMKVIVLTGILTGSHSAIVDVMDWRLNNLKQLGIELTSFGFNQTHQFKELPSYKGRYPEVKNGVILTNGSTVKKHQVLEAFLQKLEWRPKKIIFVDDTRAIVERMAAYAKKQNIDFIGYEYKGAKKAKTQPISKEALEQAWTDLMGTVLSK